MPHEKIIRYIRTFVGIFLIFGGTLLVFVYNRITGEKGQPSKYNKARAIGVFVPNFNKDGQRDCKEIVRGTITSNGDIYIFTNLKHQKEFPFHESFHESGKHHWKQGNQYLYPLAFNGAGLPVSEKFIHFRTEQPYCFCFRKGDGIKDEEIKPVIEKLIRYVPSVDAEEVVFALKTRGIFQAKRPISLRDFFRNIK